ncbi:PLxRFG domain-containing protein [Vibrio fluvialis]|uniref:PLxRFG domain-containing protein n=1 Tax=Vibrio fluvialis TaxID=676 RepID=UPI001EECD5F9|nr:PLxRFG domain-containing protein [Vibrio fluvialis]MCG6405234.1 PLxRFG domain-containing protein [Vibrio fluvialis]
MAEVKNALARFREQEQNRNTSIFGDSIDALQAGAIGMGAGIAEFVGANNTADKMDQWAQDQSKTMTNEGRDAMAKRLINDDLSLGEGATDWRTWWLQSMNVLGGMAVTMVPGGAAAKALSLGGKATTLATVGGKAVTSADAVAIGANTLLNVAGGGGQAGRGVEQDIKSLSFTDLRDSQPFRELSMQYMNEGASAVEAQDKARSTIAENAGKALTHDLSLAAINATLEPLGDRVFGKLIKGQLGKTMKGALAKGIAAEGGTEAVQGGFEQWRGNVAANDHAGTNRDEMEGVAAASLENGLLGAAMGGSASVPGTTVGKVRRQRFETNIEKAITPDVIRKLREAGNDDVQIRTALKERVSNKALELGFGQDESQDLADIALKSAFGDIPPAAQRHQEAAQVQPEAAQAQPEAAQAQPMQPGQEQAHAQQQAINPADFGLSPEDAELLTDPPAELFDSAGNFNRNAPKELKQRYYVAQNREGAQAYIDAVFEQSGAHSPYYDDMVKPGSEQQTADPVQEAQDEPQMSESVPQETANPYENETLSQKDINRLYGLANDYQPTEAATRIREQSGTALRDELMHQQGAKAGPDVVNRRYSEMGGPTDAAMRVRSELPQHERTASLRDQANQDQDQRTIQERAARDRDIKRGFLAQDSFDRESQRIQDEAQRLPSHNIDVIDQDTHYMPRERRERVEGPELSTQDIIDKYRGQRSGMLKGELMGDQVRRNTRQEKKHQGKLNSKLEAIYSRINQDNPADESPTGTEYIPNSAMADAFKRMETVTDREVKADDVAERLDVLEQAGVITPEESQAIAEVTADETKVKPRRVYGWDAVELHNHYTADELDQWIKELMADPDNLANGTNGLQIYDKKTTKKIDKLSWAVTYHHQEESKAKRAAENDQNVVQQHTAAESAKEPTQQARKKQTVIGDGVTADVAKNGKVWEFSRPGLKATAKVQIDSSDGVITVVTGSNLQRIYYKGDKAKGVSTSTDVAGQNFDNAKKLANSAVSKMLNISEEAQRKHEIMLSEIKANDTSNARNAERERLAEERAITEAAVSAFDSWMKREEEGKDITLQQERAIRAGVDLFGAAAKGYSGKAGLSRAGKVLKARLDGYDKALKETTAQVRESKDIISDIVDDLQTKGIAAAHVDRQLLKEFAGDFLNTMKWPGYTANLEAFKNRKADPDTYKSQVKQNQVVTEAAIVDALAKRQNEVRKEARTAYKALEGMRNNEEHSQEYGEALNTLMDALISYGQTPEQRESIRKGLDSFRLSDRLDALKKVSNIVNGSDDKPEPPKPTGKKDNAEAPKKDRAKPEAEMSAPGLSDRTTFTGMVNDVNKAIRGELSFDDVQQLATDLENNEQALRDDLQNHKEVKRKRKESEKKRLISIAMGRIADGLARAISPSFGSHEGFYLGQDEIKQIVSRIRKLTPEEFASRLESRQNDKQRAQDQVQRDKESLQNPVTLADFRRLANTKNGSIDAFDDAQLKEYDRLMVEHRLERLKQEQKAAAEVKAVDGEIAYQLAETIHTKKQIPMYVVQLTGDRLDKEAFKGLADRARKLGGNFVNAMMAKRFDTIDGFQFANKDDRDTFARLLDGDKVSAERRQAERQEQKTDSRVTRLMDLATSQEEKADEVINADRNTNTVRRAAMAANALDRGYTQQENAQTIRAIAKNVDKYKVLSNLSQLVQLDELNNVMRRVVWDMPEGERKKHATRNEHSNWVLKDDADIDAVVRFAKYPAPSARKDFLDPIADQLESVPGYKMAAQRIKKLTNGAEPGHMFELTGPSWEPVVDKIRQFKRSGKVGQREYLFDRIDELFKVEGRFSRMGINGPAELRHALRELSEVKQGLATKRPAETPISKLENKIVETIRANRNAFNDFFPTSDERLADQVVELADIKPGEKVLEPNAGMGHLADRLAAAGADLDVGELAYTMRQLLEEKGHNVVSDDFLEYNPGPIYDKVVMNPPFSNDAAIIHINHALTMLKPGGRLVSITPINTGDKGNSANKNFREYLDAVAAEEITNDKDAFVKSLNPTAVQTKTIVIDKPEDAATLPVPDDIRFNRESVVTGAKPKGMAIANVKRLADNWLNGYQGAKGANVTIVESQAQLNDIVNAVPGERVKGVWLSGDNRVVLVAENLEDAADVNRTLRHELVGHNAMTSLLGDGMSELADKVNTLRNNHQLKPIFESVEKAYKNVPDEVKAEEVIARLAEVKSGPIKAMADKVMAMVMGALRKAGILAKDKITITEVRDLINSADKYLRRKDGRLSAPGLVRYSKAIDENAPDYGSPTLAYEDAIKAEQNSVFEMLKGKAKAFVKGSALYDAAKGNAWGLLTLRQIAEVGKTKVSDAYGNMLDSYVHVVNRKIARQNELLESVTNLSEDIRQWIRQGNQEQADQLFDFLHEATLANVDPSGEYVDMTDDLTKSIARKKALYAAYGGSNTKRASQLLQEAKEEEAMLDREPYRRKEHAKLKTKYSKLNADQKKYFEEIRDHYANQQEQMYNALIDRIVFADSSEDMTSGQKAKVGKNTALRMQHEMGLDLERSMAQKGFYGPLARFGSYWVSTKWDTGKKDRRTGEAVTDSQFEMFESEEEMRQRYNQLKAAGYKPNFGTNIEQSGLISGATMGFVSDLMDSISGAHMGDDAKASLKDEVYQMYLSALPDRSIRKAYIHRKGTKGFSDNALRAIVDQGFKQSRQQARLETEDDLNSIMKGISDIAREERNNISAQRIASEMNRRHDWVMNPQRGKLAQKLTGFGFFWMIGASPASAMMNLTQCVQVAVPVIGAKYGMVKATTEMTKLTGQWFKHAPDIMRNAENVRTYGVLGSTLKADERQAMGQAIQQGVIDVTQMSDALELAEKPDSDYGDMKDRVIRTLGAGFHYAEVLNREVTFMTAYRLAKQDGHDNPYKYAVDATWKSHFDYGSLNRARFMQGDVATVALQFKQYSQNMTYFLMHNAFKALGVTSVGKNASKEERALARRELMGTMAITWSLGGISALPLATVASIANLAYNAFGDEDEPFDAETELKAWLGDLVGKEWADVIYRGLPPTVGLPALSSRINVDLLDMWMQQSDAQDASGTISDIGEQFFGPAGGIITGMARGVDYAFEGRYMRAAEQFMPKWVRDITKTARYSMDGGNVTNKHGEIIVSDLSAIEYATQALGFTPTRLSEQYEMNSAIKGYELSVQKRRRTLLTKFIIAKDNRDESAIRELMKQVKSYNGSEWGRLNPITSDTLMKSMRAHEMQKKRADNGLHINPRFKQLVNQQFAEY